MEPDIKNELASFIKEVPPSQIPLAKETPKEPVKINLSTDSKEYWSQKSRELYDFYTYGHNLGQYGVNKIEVGAAFERIAKAVVDIIKNECTNEKVSSERFVLHFNMLVSIMSIIGKELESEDKKIKTDNILASLHGFLESYLQNRGR